MPFVKDRGVVNLKLFFLGISILTLIGSILVYNFEVFFLSNDEIRTSNNFIFGRIFNSFDTEGSSVSLKKEFGGRLQLSKSVLHNDVVMSFPDQSATIIDGSTPPVEIGRYSDFFHLSRPSRIMLSLAFLKLNSDESHPLFLLWKGVGVHPLPDLRWVKHKGLFSLPQNVTTGIAEIDWYLADGAARVSESFQFARQHSLNRQYGLTEPELKWAYVFLQAFGSIVEGEKIILAPMIFARHAIARGMEIRRTGNQIEVIAPCDMEKGSEVLLNGNEYLSDVWTLLFQGSWVLDDSLHRVALHFSEEPPNNVFPKWISNDAHEQQEWRGNVNDMQALKQWVKFLKPKLTKQSFSNEAIDRMYFVQFNLLLNELIFAQKKLHETTLAMMKQ